MNDRRVLPAAPERTLGTIATGLCLCAIISVVAPAIAASRESETIPIHRQQPRCQPKSAGVRSEQENVIDGATVISMTRSQRPEVQTVVIRDGTIAAVTSGNVQSTNANAVHMDGRGCFLIPGLIDMHVHLYDAESLPSYLRHGVTTVVNLNGNQSLLELRAQLAAGRRLGPQLFTAGPAIDGDPALNPLFASVTDTASARAEVRRQRKAGYDFIKVYSGLTPSVYRAILDEARREHIAVVGHAPLQVGIDAVVSSGQSNIAHVEEFFQNPVDDAHFPALVAAAKRSGTTVTPNLVAYSDYLRSIADLPASLANPEMRFVSPASLNEKLPVNNRSVRPNPAAFANLLRARSVRFRVLTKMLSDAGVPLFLGTDTEIFGLAGDSEQLELGELVGAGLTSYQALFAATAAAGEFLTAKAHAPSRGTIAPGARADLVLLSANPLLDIGNADSVRGVVVGGRWLATQTLDIVRDSIARADAPIRTAMIHFDSLAAIGRFAEAVRVIEDAHRAMPSVPPLAQVVIPRYARRAAERGDTSAAVAIAALAVTLYPTSGASYRGLARFELMRGDTSSARTNLIRALELEPHHAWAELTAKQLGIRRPPT